MTEANKLIVCKLINCWSKIHLQSIKQYLSIILYNTALEATEDTTDAAKTTSTTTFKTSQNLRIHKVFRSAFSLSIKYRENK